jgi:putative DNA methylase
VTEKRKLIEVALQLEAISDSSAHEKSVPRKGHPATLHLWWARRPLAACRAIIFASYVDDPSSHPDRFPTEEAQQAERDRLFEIIEELVKWENTTNEEVLNAAREEIRKSCGDDPPPVYDPFCGGGSIPLEAQRLGLTAYASDLNPVAVLITKALIEIPPEFAGRPPVHPDDGKLKGTGIWTGARGLAEDVRYYGKWIRDEAERRVGHLYPKVELPAEHGGGEATVIAWIWARTVKSPNPAWGGPMPLVRSFALSTKKGKETWVQPIVDRENKRIRFEIRTGPGRPDGTVGRSGAVCLATGTPVPLSYIREEAKAGRMGTQLLAIVAEGNRRRLFLSPDDLHEQTAKRVAVPDSAPDSDLPERALSFRVQAYGMTKHRDLFTPRQLLGLCTFSDLISELRSTIEARDPPRDYPCATATYLAFALSKLADWCSSICTWIPTIEGVGHTFTRQAIPITWDFAEINPFSSSVGNWLNHVEWSASTLETSPAGLQMSAVQADAAVAAPPGPLVAVTDPPYYDNIGYADLSDFFYIWLRRSLRDCYPEIFGTLLVPKSQEIIASPHRFGGDKTAAERHFESSIGAAFERMRDAQPDEYPMTIIYAFKQAEQVEAHIASTGWEKMLDGLLLAGFMVVGTWPLRSERSSRMVSQGTNSLASSVALVCRRRPVLASLATRKEVLSALKAELPGALRHLQQGSIAPVDLAQAAIGPGMAVFSRYSKVVEADGSAMSVRTALGLINQVLDETLAEQEADFDGDTRWAVAWFEQYGMNPGPFGVAETLSKAKNTAINGLVAAGILESKAGKVRLLDRTELPDAWDPAADSRLTVWELAQHLIRALESGGEDDAADLLRRVGGLGETARELAYRLYVICERKKWAKEALAYNALVVAWPEISRLAAAAPAPSGPAQQELL